MKDSDFFELFVFEQVLKDYDLSQDELESGRVNGSDDGGIDGFFLLINGSLVEETIDKSDYKKTNPQFDLYIIQAKREKSFGEKAYDKFQGLAKNILTFDIDKHTLTDSYSEAVVDAIQLFQESYLELIDLHPRLVVHFVCATKGDTGQINARLKQKEDMVIRIAKETERSARQGKRG